MSDDPVPDGLAGLQLGAEEMLVYVLDQVAAALLDELGETECADRIRPCVDTQRWADAERVLSDARMSLHRRMQREESGALEGAYHLCAKAIAAATMWRLAGIEVHRAAVHLERSALLARQAVGAAAQAAAGTARAMVWSLVGAGMGPDEAAAVTEFATSARA